MTIENNSADVGGGITCNSNGYFYANNIIVQNNSSFIYGGGINITASSPLITSSLIDNNITSGDGGGIYLQQGANIQIINSIFQIIRLLRVEVFV